MKLYSTVKKEAVSEQVIEKSRFIAHVKPVSSREEADLYIQAVKKKYRDATHNVPAMVIGDKMQIQWASDDGEPQGTSGPPIAQMLVKEGITNVVCVVTRYFGGIKLGPGGLVRAYTSSAKLAIENAGIGDCVEKETIKIKIEYSLLSKLQNMEGDLFKISNIEYLDQVIVSILTDSENSERAIESVSNLTLGRGIIVSREKGLVIV